MRFSLSESEMKIKSPGPETQLFGRPPKHVRCPSGATAASHGSTHVSPGYVSRARRYSTLAFHLSPLKHKRHRTTARIATYVPTQGKKMKSSKDRLSMAVTGHVTSSSGDTARPMSCSQHSCNDGWKFAPTLVDFLCRLLGFLQSSPPKISGGHDESSRPGPRTPLLR